MADSTEVVLWRAPSAGCLDPEKEVLEGFDSAHYPGNGVYFALYRPLALEFQRCYGNGLQEIHLSKDLFDDLVESGVIRSDPYYPEGQCWHVLPDRIPAFNEAFRRGSSGFYHSEKTV